MRLIRIEVGRLWPVNTRGRIRSFQMLRSCAVMKSWAQVKFEDLTQGRVRLTENSPFRCAGLDGTDVGVDDALGQTARLGGDGRR